ncbi:protein kinase family protein [Salinibacillus xinjiangensis]|uniref:Spore coat protein YutH n=1 Tax=Salinibacillus xinjiangensis TaxID=1229268 RepID=A0A6G1X2X1_9BACI|nr:hypothetical protein [Salinibacillus xinjiangensis]MRG85178.1 hypothetical protein [Salinibacillus xinjiangensis]
MKDILKRNYSFHCQYETTIAGLEAFRGTDGYAMVFPADYIDEHLITEQYVIADYLNQNGFHHVAKPLYSNEGHFIVPLNEESSVYACHVSSIPERRDVLDLAEFLPSFHQAGHGFPYTPLHLNRYGQWKTNWEQIVDQLEVIRSSLIEKRFISDWERLWIESCFYFIGLGENAIQFLQESERENLYNQFDQPVFTLERINPFPHEEIILPNRIVHDHPSRDLAELIRHLIVTKGRNAFEVIPRILERYQNQRPLSLFGWRLLFSRLVFPIHFIDYTEDILSKERITEDDYHIFNKMLSDQAEYEYGLQLFSKEMERHFDMNLEVIGWIYD